MITLMISKWVGDVFNNSIYDEYIELVHIPLLPWKPFFWMRKYKAKDVMCSSPTVFHELESVQTIYTAMQEDSHNGYPVVDKHGEFRGLILRYLSIHLSTYLPSWERSLIPPSLIPLIQLLQ